MSAVVLATPGVSRGAVIVSKDSVTLKWNPSTGAEGYYLLYAPYEAEPFEGPFTGRIDVGNRTSIPFEVREGEGFHVAVKAYNEVGKSSKSNVVSFIRPAEERNTTPIVKIFANQTTGHLNVPEGTPVSLSVTLDRIGDEYGSPDVWIVADTPLGLYSYHGYSGWVAGVYPFERTLSGTTVFELPSLYLSQGYYTFYLSVDNNADRVPDATWWDVVGVNVTESSVW
jgi:hypothetical protein